MKKFKLKDIDDTRGTHKRIRSFILETLSDKELLSSTEKELCFHSLKCFNFRRQVTIDNLISIKECCKTILHKAGIYDPEVDPIDNDENFPNDPITLFVKEVLCFDQLPFKHHIYLKNIVEKDLKTINNITSYYESLDFIDKYIQQRESPRNHYQRTLCDFYLRCEQEKNIVLNYYLNGISKRATEKAHRNGSFLGLAYKLTEEYRDRPYRVWIPFSDSYFDHRKIDKCSHRVGNLPVKIANPLIDLYDIDKSNFYKKLSKHLPPSEIFKRIEEYYLRLLPRIEKRQEVFAELKFTFQKRKWFSFTALALVLVEGLFSDMFTIINKNKPSFGALPDKVNAIRPNFHLHESHFDYFQYHLPNLRNSFLHFGNLKDDDPRLIAHDLLYDLNYILHVFDQLQSPLIELNAILKKSETDFLNGIGDFNYLFALIKKVKANKQFEEVESEWKFFEEHILTQTGIFEYYAFDLVENFDSQLSLFLESLKSSSDSKWDLTTVNWDEIKSKKKEIITEIESSIYLKEQFVEMTEINIFLNSYKSYLPSCSNEASEALQNIKDSHIDFLSKISYLYAKKDRR